MRNARKDPAFGRVGTDSAQIHNHQDPERLRDELADYLENMTEETFDSARLEAILDALEEVSPVTDLPDGEERLAQFHRKYAYLFDEDAAPAAETTETSPQKKPDEKKPSRRKRVKLLPLVAILAVLITVSAQAFNFRSILELFTRWTSETFYVGGEQTSHASITKRPLEEGEEATYDSLQEALDAFGIKAPLAPTWIPERFALESVTAVNGDLGVHICANYIGDEEFLIARYREITADTMGLEEKGPQVTMFSCGGFKHRLTVNYEQYNAYWQNGELNCFINGTVSEEELMNIITSIYEGE